MALFYHKMVLTVKHINLLTVLFGVYILSAFENHKKSSDYKVPEGAIA